MGLFAYVMIMFSSVGSVMMISDSDSADNHVGPTGVRSSTCAVHPELN